MDPEIKRILDKYESKLKKDINLEEESSSKKFSSDYLAFREDSLTKVDSSYEELCNFSESIIKIKVSKEKEKKLEEAIETIHLNIKPEGASSFAFISAFILIFLGLVILGFSFLMNLSTLFIFLSLLFIIIGAVLIKPLTNIPIFIANKFRLKASNQMVLCILYIVIYMRHTSNLERAIKFASDHLNPPLSLDLRKILWDVETGKYSTVKESLENYLKRWRDYNLEFVEALHLIQSSLVEPSEDRRVTLLEKSLEVILTGTYEKMLHYAQELKNPITMLHMLGIILPILGLVILPLLGSLLGGSGLFKIIFLFIIYDVLLPLVVYVIGTNILSKRPTGYNEVEILDEESLKRYKNIILPVGNREILINPFFFCFIIGLLIMFIGLIPVLLHYVDPTLDFSFKGIRFFDYRLSNGEVCESLTGCYGPFGFGSVLFSLFAPFGLALGLGTYYILRTRKLIKIRSETKKLEQEFSGSLFQLGNRIGDGIPVEIAFGEVAKNMQGTPTGDFFRIVDSNIRKLGMDVKQAIFNLNNGALSQYPSSLIESSMKVLVESAKKGPQIVSSSLISVSNYIARIHSVNERLKDLLSDIISSMKSQINFLTPVIAGIVVGISSMIVTILIKLTGIMSEQQAGLGASENLPSALEGLGGLFSIPDIIPGYFLQLVVGIYVFEITILLTILASGIENGPDKLFEKYQTGKNLYTGMIIYSLVAFIVTIIFTFLALAIQFD